MSIRSRGKGRGDRWELGGGGRVGVLYNIEYKTVKGGMYGFSIHRSSNLFTIRYD